MPSSRMPPRNRRLMRHAWRSGARSSNSPRRSMNDRWLTELAAAIADGATIDWSAAEAHAGATFDESVIARLKIVERITRGHAGAIPQLQVGGIITHWGPFTDLELVGRGTFGD